MTTAKDRWQLAHKRAAARKPWVRLDRVSLQERKGARGYEVLIEGFNLIPAISPPSVTIAGEPLQELEFGRDGRSLRGVLLRKPASLRVVVDYGFAKAELNG